MKFFCLLVGLGLALLTGSSAVALMSQTDNAEILALQRKGLVTTFLNPGEVYAARLAEHNRQVMESMSHPPIGFDHYDHPPVMSGPGAVAFIKVGPTTADDDPSSQGWWMTAMVLFACGLAALAAWQYMRRKANRSDKATHTRRS